MIWIPILVFLAVLVLVVGGYFLLGTGRGEKAELKKRLSLLEAAEPQGRGSPGSPEERAAERCSAVEPAAFPPELRRPDRPAAAAGGSRYPGRHFVLLSLTLFASGMVVGKFLHWPAVLSVCSSASCCSSIPNLVVDVKRRLRIKRFMSHFPDALEMFARSLRAGHSFTGAIQLVAQEMPDPIGPEFRKVFDEQNLGIPLRQALIGMTDRVDTLDVKFFATAILIQRETGGNLAEIIDKISYVIRERFRVQGQLKIFTAQARMSGFILAFLPIGVALLIGIAEPGVPETAVGREDRQDHDRHRRRHADSRNAGHPQDHPDQDLSRGAP